MKQLLLILFVGLALFGCGADGEIAVDEQELDLDDSRVVDEILEKAIDGDEAQVRGELTYMSNKQTPLTGWVKQMYANGQVEELRSFKDGKSDGPFFLWHRNGQKKMESHWEDGQLDGPVLAWSEDGQKLDEAHLQDLMLVAVPGSQAGTDFVDASETAATQPKEKQLQVKLKQRQKNKAQPTLKNTFKTTAISDVVMPEFNDLDVTDINPVISTSAPSVGDVGTGNDAKGALEGLGLALPKPMQSRCDPKTRISRLVAGGGDRNTETAIMRGLDWLKANQDADGSWGAKDKDDQGNLKPMDKNAMTGMALLCFLGHCELPDSPKYGATVSKAIQFLASTPADAFTGRECYSHPIRTYALCEAYTMTKMKKLESIAKKATEVIIKGQNESGGWAYGYVKGVTAHVDLSVTGWNIQALKAAALTGIRIEGLDEAMDKAVAYVKRCQDSTGKFAYKEGSTGKPSLTGTGVLCLQIWKNAKSEEAVKGLDWIVQNQATEWSKVNVYEWYYHAQACFQATGVAGGTKYWRAWNQDFQKIVLQAQNRDGHWPHGAHFHGDTAIYRTTMTILMLEVYYRYAPMGGGRAD